MRIEASPQFPFDDSIKVASVTSHPLDLFFSSSQLSPLYAPGFEFENQRNARQPGIDIPKLCPSTRRYFWSIIKSPVFDRETIDLRAAVVTSLISEKEKLVELVNLVSTLAHQEEKIQTMASGPDKGFTTVPFKETAVKLCASIRSFEGEFFSKLADELDRTIDLIPENLDKAVYQSVTDESEIKADTLSGLLTRLSPTTGIADRFSSIAAFAFIAARDAMNVPTFDESKPEHYQKAWNFLKQKENPGVPQIRCSSPDDAPLVVLTGSSMSGTNFYLKRDLLIRLCAQSFGYVPAERANLHLADSFCYFTPSNPNDQGDESKFSSAVVERCHAEKKLGVRARIYDVQPFSNTADRLPVAWGWTRHYLDRGAKIITVTQDQALVDKYERECDAGVYHLGTSVGVDGSLNFDRCLYKNHDTTHAWEIGKSLGLSDVLLDAATRYRRDAPPVIGPVIVQQTSINAPCDPNLETFDRFFPQGDELIVRTSSVGKVLSWKKNLGCEMPPLSAMHLDSEDRVLQVMGDGTAFTPAALRASPFFARAKRTGDKYFDRSVEDYLALALLYSATSNASEISSRQKLFSSLLQGDVLATLDKATSNLTYHLCAVSSALKFGSLYVGGPLCEQFVDELIKDLDEGHNSTSQRALISYIGEVLKSDSRIYGTGPESIELPTKILLELNLISLFEDEASEFEKGDYDSAELVAAEKTQQVKFSQLVQRLDTLPLDANQADAMYSSAARRAFATAAKKSLSVQLRESVSTFRPRKFSDLDQDLLREETERLHHRTDTITIYYPRSKGCAQIKMIEALTYRGNIKDEFLDALRAVDSPYVASYADRIQDPLNLIMQPFPDGQSVSAMINQGKRVSIQQAANQGTWSVSCVHFIREVAKLRAVLAIAQTLHDEHYCKVDFHGGSDLEIHNGWMALLPKDSQVPNSTSFANGSQVHIHVGSNRSGKSFDLRKILMASNLGQVTGYGPAETMAVPIQKFIGLYDRVAADKQSDVEAWESEIADLNRLDAATAFPCLIGFDEVMASISPDEQEAGVAALSQVYAERGATVIHVTHAIPVAQALMSANPGKIEAFHFKTNNRKDGGIDFGYQKEPGLVENANAIPLMRTMNVPPSVIHYAEQALYVDDALLPE